MTAPKEPTLQGLATALADETLQSVHDGLENLLTGMGTDNDKSTGNRWVRSGRNRDHDELITRYREDWVAQKVCDIIPQDLTRKWRRCKTPEAQAADKKFRVKHLFRDAYKWARVFGTSAIILDIRGSGASHTPLNLDRLKRNCIRGLQVVDRTRLMPTGQTEMNALSPHYGFPTHYMLGGSTVSIHHSRILRFEGTPLTRYETWKNQWYSDSILIPLASTIDNFHVSAQAAAALVQEANVDVVTVQGLQQLLTHPAGEQAVMKRFRMMKTLKSNHNVLVLDDTEEYTTKTIALNGVKDLIWEYLRIVAAACGIPATRFLSASPDGMNATGESDLNNYSDMLEGEQAENFDPRLEVIDKLIAAHCGLPPIEYEWVSPFPESALTKEERRKTLSEALNLLVTGGVLTGDTAIKVLESEHVFKLESLGKAPPPPAPTGNPSSNASKKTPSKPK